MSSKKRKPNKQIFISAFDDAQSARLKVDSPQCGSSSFRLAYQDEEFLLRDELRPVRLQLELLKPELILQENHIESTVVIFGSARIPEPQTAEARLVSAEAEYRKNKNGDALKQKVNIARQALANSKYKRAWEVYPFNSGYFMCLRLKTVDAETLRVHLLEKYGVGLISLGKNDLRVAFSSVEKEDVQELFDIIFQGVEDLKS